MLASLGSSNYTLDHQVVAGEINKTRTYYPDTDDVTSQYLPYMHVHVQAQQGQCVWLVY